MRARRDGRRRSRRLAVRLYGCLVAHEGIATAVGEVNEVLGTRDIEMMGEQKVDPKQHVGTAGGIRYVAVDYGQLGVEEFFVAEIDALERNDPSLLKVTTI